MTAISKNPADEVNDPYHERNIIVEAREMREQIASLKRDKAELRACLREILEDCIVRDSSLGHCAEIKFTHSELIDFRALLERMEPHRAVRGHLGGTVDGGIDDADREKSEKKGQERMDRLEAAVKEIPKYHG